MSSSLTLAQSKAAQPALVRIEANKSTAALPADPLPADPLGQRLCEIFGSYLYCSIYADAPKNATEKPKWHTQRRYKLKNRVLYRDWQDAEKLIGVRPGHTIGYGLLDIDINSPHHPRQDAGAITRIEAALETIGITRTLRIRSSWSEGIHLYLPLPELVKTFDLAVALKNCLEPQGFKLKQGHLECFPNVKAYGNLIKTEYLAHRLPLQPASGACLLDEALNPASSKLGDFLNHWDFAAAGQDTSTLKQALPLARKNRFKKVRSRLNKVDSWKRDLETVLAEGWTGPGQTNQLLKEIGCYGHVFLSHDGEELVDFIHQQAISSPGYGKWCRHQHEIRMRSRVWAVSVEKYYWPLGTYSNASRKAQNKIVPFNDLRARSAQESIRAAVRHLESVDGLPERATARAQAIRTAQADLGASSSSLETLYKAEHKALWHPDFYGSEGPVIDETTGVSSAENVTAHLNMTRLEPPKSKELRTKREIMKCESAEADVFPSAKTKFYSGKGGTGGVKRFPQDKSKHLPLHRTPKPSQEMTVPNSVIQKPLTRGTLKLPKLSSHKSADISARRDHRGISKAVSETITAIQNVVQKLGWPIDEVSHFIAKKFQGKRRAQLSDEELINLLYSLQAQYLEETQAILSSV